MSVFRHLRLFFLVLFSSCFGSGSLPKYQFKIPDGYKEQINLVYVDEEFSAIEKSIIRDALNEWSFKTKNYLKWEYKNWKDKPQNLDGSLDEPKYPCKRTIIINRIISTSPIVVDIETKLNFKIAGLADMHNFENCYITQIYLVVDKLYSYSQFRVVMIHETGHFLGIKHNNQFSIMSYKYMWDANGITDYDLKELEKIIKNDNCG